MKILKLVQCYNYTMPPYLEDANDRIITYLKAKGMATREEICKALGLEWTTAFDHLDELARQGKVEKVEKKDEPGKGRPQVYWRLKK